MRNNIYEPSPQVDLESAELRGPLGGLGEGTLSFWGQRGATRYPLRGPWVAL